MSRKSKDVRYFPLTERDAAAFSLCWLDGDDLPPANRWAAFTDDEMQSILRAYDCLEWEFAAYEDDQRPLHAEVQAEIQRRRTEP